MSHGRAGVYTQQHGCSVFSWTLSSQQPPQPHCQQQPHSSAGNTQQPTHRRVKRTRSALCQPLPSLLRCRSHSLPTLSPSPLA